MKMKDKTIQQTPYYRSDQVNSIGNDGCDPLVSSLNPGRYPFFKETHHAGIH